MTSKTTNGIKFWTIFSSILACEYEVAQKPKSDAIIADVPRLTSPKLLDWVNNEVIGSCNPNHIIEPARLQK